MLSKLFRHNTVPAEYRSNFLHLYLDIGWFGVLSGSAVNFLNVYATRLGATGFQIGLLSGTSALISLFVAIPAGRWLERRHTSRAVFWASVLYRIGFFLWIPLPWIFDAQGQIWVLIFLALLMGIPLTALGVGFSALFAEAIPSDWRAHVAAIRNIVVSFTFMITSVISGAILERASFPIGYQIVFTIGAIGAAMSSLHLYFVSPKQSGWPVPKPKVQPVSIKKSTFPSSLFANIRADIWKTPYRTILLVFLGFHLAQYLALPLFPLYMVNALHLNDEQIGIGTALFYLTVLFGSTQLSRLVRRMGHKNVTALGVIGLCIYPILMALSRNAWHYYGLSAIGGFNWALVGGAYLNYLLEYIPEDDRPAHLAWYNIILNFSILTGSLAGPLIANQVGLPNALIIAGILRLLAGVAIFKWG